MDQKSAFEKAVNESKELTKRPDNETMLRLYSLYKQATTGDLGEDAPKPVMFDFVAQAKYDAWLKLKGTLADDAMAAYIELVAKLKSLEE
ncbi:acyl-CoA-binding protein [Mucilaginibacter xinganensis]|uniref:Acyl-CoA-binding protein n=1 Tax=Mucilaginibacter xinganensis TaxID=1234841 RepID=A0A223P3X7_9SPHI|nr:acyl-CoA-binding protein [Mucilaginibacter xinganensis]ASU36740.1 acyl-CoA-binding protein [Mucilaginibacter xinganensis]